MSAPSAPIRPVARVALRKNLARAVRAGHPWIYRDALRPAPPLPDGALVLVTTGDGRPLGRGFWTATTPIALRMLTTEPADQIESLVRTRLAAALEHRLSFLDLDRTNAFRWVHGEADLLPGLHLDVYGRVATIRFDGTGARAFYGNIAVDVIAAGAPLSIQTLVERRAERGVGAQLGGAKNSERNREKNGVEIAHAADDDAAAADVNPRADARLVLAGPPPAGVFEIRENGLLFEVDLLRGQKGGLFLDQRENRQRVRELGHGRRVLNMFGYTGGFSIYAAAGGAESTTTVDSSGGAISAARRNFARNALSTEKATFVAQDAFAFLTAAARSGARWDLVISDPPSFAPSHRALPDALRAYRRLHSLCAAVVEPGGILCAASCSSHVDEAAFAASIAGGAADAGRRFVPLEQHGAGADHPILAVFREGQYLKFNVGRVT